MAIEKKRAADEAEAKKNKAPDGWADGLIYYAEPLDPQSEEGQ